MAEETLTATLTLKDIAREAGVSLATVDRVLHNRPGVRPDTVRRVKAAIERNSFQPHVAAAELARGRARSRSSRGRRACATTPSASSASTR